MDLAYNTKWDRAKNKTRNKEREGGREKESDIEFCGTSDQQNVRKYFTDVCGINMFGWWNVYH